MMCAVLGAAISLSMLAFASAAESQSPENERIAADALVFETQADADAYFENIENPESYDVAVTETVQSTNARTGDQIRNYDVQVTHNLTSIIHLCYSYTVTNGTRYFGSLYGTPFVSMSGYHPGIDYEQKSATVTKQERQRLSARFVVYYKYYVLAKPISMGSKTYEYNIKHDIMVGPQISSINEM